MPTTVNHRGARFNPTARPRGRAGPGDWARPPALKKTQRANVQRPSTTRAIRGDRTQTQWFRNPAYQRDSAEGRRVAPRCWKEPVETAISLHSRHQRLIQGHSKVGEEARGHGWGDSLMRESRSPGLVMYQARGFPPPRALFALRGGARVRDLMATSRQQMPTHAFVRRSLSSCSRPGPWARSQGPIR